MSKSITKRKELIKNIGIIAFPTIIIIIIVCELIFRFVIPACETPLADYDFQDQITKFDINGPRIGLKTSGIFGRKGGHWNINNFGWNSAIDYSIDRQGKSLLAIIGDSYIEAFQVDTDKNIAARLREKLNNNYEVYSFGFSEAPLSQYLQMSRYVRKYFNPDILVINVVHNDFDESLSSVKYVPGFLHLEVNDLGVTEAKIKTFERISNSKSLITNLKTNLLVNSSLMRYLLINCHLYNRYTEIRKYFRKNKNNIAKKEIESKDALRSKIYLAIDYIVHKIKEENKGKTIIFMIDAPRLDIYNNSLDKSNLIWMNHLLKDRCDKYRVHFIDLTNYFTKEFNEKHERFNEPWDYHWNEYGHQIAAESLFNELRSNDLLGNY